MHKFGKVLDWYDGSQKTSKCDKNISDTLNYRLVCHATFLFFLQFDFFWDLGTFRSEDKDDYEYEFSVLSTRTSKNVGLQTLCACSVRKTRTRSRPRPPPRPPI